MSESGGFGGGFSDSGGGGGWGGGYSDQSSGSFPFSGGIFSGGGGSSVPFSGGAADAGPIESGTFGGGFIDRAEHRESNSSFLPAIEGGIAGFILGRGTAPRASSAVVYPAWTYGSPYYSQPPPYMASPPQVVTSYAPIGTGRRPLRPVVFRSDGGPTDPRARAKRFLRFGFAASCIAAFVLYFILFASHTVELREREQHLFSANSWFAASIKIAPVSRSPPLSFRTSVYSFPSRPSASASLADKFQLGQDGVVVPRYGFQAWPVWLNRGSSVHVSHHLPSGAALSLVVVRGRDNMEQWKDDPRGKEDEGHGVIMEHPLSGKGSVSFTAHRDGLFFFALANFRSNPVTCDLYLDVASWQYDLRAAEDACDLSSDASAPCEVALPFGHPKYALLATTPGSDPKRPQRGIRVSYSPRVPAYLLLLFSPTLALLFIRAVLLLRGWGQGEGQGQGQPAAGVLVPPVPSVSAEATSAPGHQTLGQPQAIVPGAVAPSAPPMGLPPSAGASAGAVPGQPGSKAPIPDTWVSSGTPGAAAAPADTTPLLVPSAPSLEAEVGAVAGQLGARGGGASRRRGREEDACAVCMEAPKDSVILDCGHRATCFSCGKLLQEQRNPQCPICRQPIRQVTRVYDV